MKMYEKVVIHYRRKRRILKKCIIAIEQLLAIYENLEEYARLFSPPSCPLCSIPCGIPGEECGNCPWVVITGSSVCRSLASTIRSPLKRPARIKQLRQWIAAYKKADEILALRRSENG